MTHRIAGKTGAQEKNPTMSFVIKSGWEDHGIDQNYIPYHIILRNTIARKHIFDCYVSKSKLSLFLERVKASDELKNNKTLMEVYFEKFLKEAAYYANSIEKSVVIITSELPFAAELFLECKYEIRKTQFLGNSNPLIIRGVYFIKEGTKE